MPSSRASRGASTSGVKPGESGSALLTAGSRSA